jgi:hypothetical protein
MAFLKTLISVCVLKISILLIKTSSATEKLIIDHLIISYILTLKRIV